MRKLIREYNEALDTIEYATLNGYHATADATIKVAADLEKRMIREYLQRYHLPAHFNDMLTNAIINDVDVLRQTIKEIEGAIYNV